MSKKSSKQPTLFQSWSNSQVKNGSQKASSAFNHGKIVESADNNNVYDIDDLDDPLFDDALVNTLQQVEKNAFQANPTSRLHNLANDVEIIAPNATVAELLPGFDLSSGHSWIYPTNYPIRDYQFNIVKASLFKNTLVTLPTGLGKTFIGAVIMFNFYRWYPRGKIIFMAPTKPLVAQQIEACYNIMGLPQNDTTEMTGSISPTERKAMWEKNRVFFLTPQIITNDITRGICPAELVRCIVFDEAHKALGNHAYCQVVQELLNIKCAFRVLALSATPGTDVKSVQQVIDNLCIAHVEIRSEDSIDIQPYTHQREIQKIVVRPGEDLLTLIDTYVRIISHYVNRLINRKAMPKRDPKSLSKFILLKAREAFRLDPPAGLPPNQYGSVEGDFALCMSLYHAYELLQLHGTRSFYNFLKGLLGHPRAANELMRNEAFSEMMSDLEGKYRDEAFNKTLLPGSQSVAEHVDNDIFVISHPKMMKLKELLQEFFKKCKDDNLNSRCMVFSQYRDSVIEITEMLNRIKPLVQAMSFVGQKTKVGKNGKGITQKQQIKVVKDFKAGGYNTLVCTCVGEEGLDIGEVDLIICYDSPTSPIRLVQRMGRTGRQRKGKIIVLVTEGKEEQMYNQSMYSKKSIHKALVNGTKLRMSFKSNPRMIPIGLNPECIKLHMTMSTYQAQANSNSRTYSKFDKNS
ncbi:Fanconi anemia group M protein [Nymphon striatum]|nr:Fanconi anemia group M protein [Nymphon striatum]